MTPCQIALGGNVGDVRGAFYAALAQLRCPELEVVAVSQCFETPPMGDAAGATFLNAAATVETTLDAETLLARLLELEDRAGRVRAVHWGPRVIDLDLILFGDEVIETPRLRVPHPASWYRRFVLEPLMEIAPQVVHPEAGESIEMLREKLLVRPFHVAVSEQGAKAILEREFADAFPEVLWCDPGDRQAVMTLLIGHDRNHATERAIGVAEDPSLLISSVRAILMAALGEPHAAGAICPLPVR